MPHAARAVAFAALFGAVAQLLFFRHGPGVNVPLAVALFLALAWSHRARDRRVRRRDAWVPAAAVLFASFCAFRADVMLLVFDVLTATTLSVATVVAWSGVRVTDLPAASLVAEALRAVGALLVRGATVVGTAWPLVTARLGARVARAGGYGAGVLLAAPFLFVFASLFGSADAVFAQTLSDAFDLRRWLDALGDVPGRLVVASIAAWAAAGALFRLRTAPRSVDSGPRRGWLAIEPATVALLCIDALFAVFVTLQIAYLFGGRDTVEAARISFSQYARRGFFELIAVATLVGVVLFGAELAVRRRSRAFIGAALALVALCAVVLVSAAYRLDLYQRAYGWTEQRFYAVAMIVFLTAALAILAWGLARGTMRWALQPLAIAALTVAAGVNVMAPSEYIVRANVARVLEPSSLPPDAERGLDAWYLVTLGDGAVPALVEALRSLPDAERQRLGTRLRQEAEWRVRPEQPWQTWNVDRERARRALIGARDELLGYPPYTPVIVPPRTREIPSPTRLRGGPSRDSRPDVRRRGWAWLDPTTRSGARDAATRSPSTSSPSRTRGPDCGGRGAGTAPASTGASTTAGIALRQDRLRRAYR